MARIAGLPDDLIKATRAAFDKSGAFVRAIEGFTPRAQQQTLALEIAEAILSKGRLVAEAGTGTGKTFAYLVPSLLSGKKTIVSTATKMLQDQLVNKDLPTLMRVLSLGLRVQNLKGRANYLCEHRIRLFTDSTDLTDKKIFHALIFIRENLGRLKEGSREELPEISEDATVWPYATSTSENCLGTKCSYHANCFLNKARRRAMDADLVVINHHLFFADAKLKEEGFGSLLPGVEIVIFDEAHQLPETATAFFGYRLGTKSLMFWQKDVLKNWPVLSPYYDTVQDNLFALAEVIDGLRALPFLLGRFHFLRINLQSEFSERWLRLKTLLLELKTTFITEGVEIRAEHHERLYHLLRRLEGYLEFFTQLDLHGTSYVAWGEKYEHHLSFSLTPIQIAKQYESILKQDQTTYIWTSATLAVEAEFSSFLNELGIHEAKTLLLPSPYDFENQALLYLPRGLPDPRHEHYYLTLVEHMVPIVRLLQGRCFFLFTSFEGLNHVARLLPQYISLPILIQGSESKSVLLAKFRELGNAILLGSATFWEGVDVKGEALSCVLIDKLPFANPTDPAIQAKNTYFAERGQSGFEAYSLPTAVIALKQGVGRLIRGENDRGLIVIADPRLTSRKYGEVIFKSLPPLQRTRDFHKVLAFVEGLAPEEMTYKENHEVTCD